MGQLPTLGKINYEFFDRVIYPHLGHSDSTVMVKPQNGVDFGVVDLGDKVMVLSTNPFYIARDFSLTIVRLSYVH
jgi:hydrogenase maturation factor